MSGRKFAFDFLNAAFYKTLAVFGSVVLGVFTQVALRPGFGNGIDHPRTLNGFQLVQLSFELFSTAKGNGNGRHLDVSVFLLDAQHGVHFLNRNDVQIVDVFHAFNRSFSARNCSEGRHPCQER